MYAIEILNQLKEEGVRFTPQRQAVLEFILESNAHPTADEIYLNVKVNFPYVSLGTIYNTLRMLKEHGRISELSYGDMASRFDGEAKKHYHIICSKCGKVVNYYHLFANTDQDVMEESGFQIAGHRMEFYGVCPECQVALD